MQANDSIMCGYFCVGFIDFMLERKTLIDYKKFVFSLSFLVILKVHEIDKTKLSDQTKYRLYETKIIENYFIDEINKRESYSKKLNKYVTIFDYIDKY